MPPGSAQGLEEPAPAPQTVPRLTDWTPAPGRGDDGPLLNSTAAALKLDQFQTGRVGITRYGLADHSFDYTAPLGEWVHLTFVATASGTALYVNGRPHSSIAAVIDLPMHSIGANRRMARADLDELITYDEALSPPQVAALYDSYGTR